jgi:hypothetical protein
MIIKIEFQELNELKNGFPEYWLNSMFDGSISPKRKINALISSYIRLVENSITEYHLALSALNEFWEPSDSFKLRVIHRSISHFETCITDIHRGIQCFKIFRNHPELDEILKELLSDKPNFIQDRNANRIREIRNTIHHIENRVEDSEVMGKPNEKISKGNVSEGEPFMIKPEGIEKPVEGEPGQTLKLINKLQIGSFELTATELMEFLQEMGRYAKKISLYSPHSDKPKNVIKSLFTNKYG